MNFGLLSTINQLRTPYLKSQGSQKVFAMVYEVTVRCATTRVSFEKQSVFTKRNRFPPFVFGYGPKISIARLSSGCFVRKSLN